MVAVSATGLIAAVLIAPTNAQAVAHTTHCGRSAVWSVPTKVKLSKYITMTYWGTNPDQNTSGWCFQLNRTKITEKYLVLAIDGVGRYTSGKSISRYLEFAEGQIHKANAALLNSSKKATWTSKSVYVG